MVACTTLSREIGRSPGGGGVGASGFLLGKVDWGTTLCMLAIPEKSPVPSLSTTNRRQGTCCKIYGLYVLYWHTLGDFPGLTRHRQTAAL